MARILIVDDDNTIRTLLRRLLNFLGFEVAGAAENGSQAVEMARSQNPDLILMDIVMPGPMDGIEAARQIRAELDIPIIFLTGYTDDAFLDMATDAEPFAFLVKPCEEAELKAAIDLALLRKSHERHMNDSTAHYRSLTEAIPYTFRVYASDFSRLFYVSEGYEKMWRRSRESLYRAPLSFLESVHPDDRPDVREAIDQRKRGEIREIIYRILLSDGEIRWIRDSAFPIADEQGKVYQLAGITEDITAQKNIHDSFREREAQLRAIFDFAGLAIALIDTETRILRINPESRNLLGTDPEDLVGRYGLELIHPEDRGRALERLHDLREGHSNHLRLDVRFVHPDGKIAWSDLSLTSVRNDQGEVTALIVAAVEITWRKQMEEALLQAETRYRTVADNTNDWEFWIDPEGRIRFNSPSVERITGYRPEDFEPEGELFLRMIHPDDRALVRDHVEQIEHSRQRGQTTFRIIRQDGLECWIEHICQPVFDQDGRFLGVRGSNRDITERRKIEESLRESQEKLQRAEKLEAVGTLAGGIAHELNNILGILMGYAELLLDDLPEEISQQGDVQKIIDSGQRAADIIQDLLILARREVTDSRVINLDDIIENHFKTPEFTKLQSRYPHVRIQRLRGKDLLNIVGSPVHLEKAVANLLLNAFQAMSAGGILTIETGNRRLNRPLKGYDDIKEGDYVLLSVTDTGPGIPPEDIGRIFEPFYIKKKFGRGGMGLGLAMVWGTIRNHQGYIEVGNGEGQGTVFNLYFPATHATLTVKPAGLPQETYLGRGEKILVVDDVAEQREMAAKMLGKLRYEIIMAASGEEALDYLQGNAVDLVLLDMIMDKGIDGLDTFKRILAIHPNQKVIIVSGFSETERVREAQALGVRDYVKKPYMIEKLGTAVRRELDRERGVHETGKGLTQDPVSHSGDP